MTDLILKVAAPILVLILELARIGIEHFSKDKTTRRFKLILWTIVPLTLLFAFISVFQGYRSHYAEQDLQNIVKKLEQRSAPRVISPEQANSLKKFLLNKSKYSVSISSVAPDSEALRYAKRLADILKLGGWTVKDVSQAAYRNVSDSLVISTNWSSPDDGAEILYEAFEQAGLQPIKREIRGAAISFGGTSTGLLIIVGPK